MNRLYSSKSQTFTTKTFSGNFSSIQLAFLGLVMWLVPSFGFSQMVGPSAYADGNLVEYGVNGAGGYEGVDIGVSPNPAGTHFRSGNNCFGFVSNPQMNGWSTFDGDFFTPGSPENGWGLEIIDGPNDFIPANNCNDGFYGLPMGTPGSITNYQIIGTCIIITWEGDFINGAYNVHVKLDYILGINDLYYTTVVTVTNNGINIPEFYYYRNFDPDNNQSISGDFTTQNTIVSQPGTGCDKAHVKATSNLPAGQPVSYVGLAAVGVNWRAIYGGFSNRDGSDIWNNVGFTQSVGSTNFADEAIAIAYKINNLAPGQVETFKFVVILDDLAANNAINDLFNFVYPGSGGGTTSFCNPTIDTVTICSGSTVPISVNGSAVASFNWNWTPVAGLSPTTGQTVNASPTVSTLYTATGTPINPCFNPINLQIFVEVIPGTVNADAGPDMVVSCASPTTVLNGSSSTPGATFQWTGGSIVSGGTTLTPTVSGAATYTLTVTAPGGCTTIDTCQVTFSGILPNANAGPDQLLLCSVGSVGLAGSSSTPNTTFSWAGPGIVSGGNTGTPIVNAAGNYTLTVTDTINSCTQTDVVIVTQNATPPGASAGLDAVLNCLISNLNLNGSSPTPGVTFAWSGPAIVSGGATANPNVNGPGTYTLTVTDPINSCISTDVVDVTLNITPPNLAVGATQTLTCIAPTVILSSSSSTPGATFTWAGPGIVGSNAIANITVNTLGTYTVTATDPVNGCTSTSTVDALQTNNTPTVNFTGANLSGCAPVCASLTDLSTIVATPITNWTWDIQGWGISNTQNGVYCINNPGTYDVTLTVQTSDGCTSSMTMANYITVLLVPDAGFMYSPNPILENHPKVSFGNTTVGGTFYAWDFGDGTTSTIDSPEHLYGDTGTYCVTLVATAIGGCTDTASHCLHVDPEFNVFIPNTFTVNEDGLNEVFMVYGRAIKSLEARIFDRWGEELFAWSDVEKGWHGNRQNGNLCPQGVYLYRIVIIDGNNDYHEFIGHVNLIR